MCICHQRDLRILDNKGLVWATVDDTTVPVYIVDGDLQSKLGTRQRAFVLEGLRRLKKEYRSHGSDLLIREGLSVEALCEIVERYDAERVGNAS